MRLLHGVHVYPQSTFKDRRFNEAAINFLLHEGRYFRVELGIKLRSEKIFPCVSDVLYIKMHFNSNGAAVLSFWTTTAKLKGVNCVSIDSEWTLSLACSFASCTWWLRPPWTGRPAHWMFFVPLLLAPRRRGKNRCLGPRKERRSPQQNCLSSDLSRQAEGNRGGRNKNKSIILIWNGEKVAKSLCQRQQEAEKTWKRKLVPKYQHTHSMAVRMFAFLLRS